MTKVSDESRHIRVQHNVGIWRWKELSTKAARKRRFSFRPFWRMRKGKAFNRTVPLFSLKEMELYLRCLKTYRGDADRCKEWSKQFLQCRMEK